MRTHRHSCPCVWEGSVVPLPLSVQTHKWSLISLSSLCLLWLCILNRWHLPCVLSVLIDCSHSELTKHFLYFMLLILVLCIGDGFFAAQEHKLEALDSIIWDMGCLGPCAIAASQEQPLLLTCRIGAYTGVRLYSPTLSSGCDKL